MGLIRAFDGRGNGGIVVFSREIASIDLCLDFKNS